MIQVWGGGTPPDPLSEWDFRRSPYNYVGNNPISFIDPDGRKRKRKKKEKEEPTIVLKEVTVTAKAPSGNQSEKLQYRNGHPIGRHRDASDFQYWMYRTFDQTLVSELAALFGHPIGPLNNNTLDYTKAIKRYNEKRKTDKEINKRNITDKDGKLIKDGNKDKKKDFRYHKSWRDSLATKKDSIFPDTLYQIGTNTYGPVDTLISIIKAAEGVYSFPTPIVRKKGSPRK